MTNTVSARADQALPSWQSIQRIIGERVDAKRSAGIVVGVVDSDGRRVAACSDPGPGQPPLDASSVFEIGSITRVFTATLRADMVAPGEVALDEPVALLLPQSVRVPARGERQIELVDLATQTSGLPRLAANWQWEDPAHPAMASFIGLDVEARLAVVVLSNSASRIEDIGFHMLDQRAELTEERQQIDLPAEVFGRYVGLYQLDPHGTVTVTRTDGGLVAEATGLGIAPIYPATETGFFVKVIPVELTFQLGPRGVATGVVVRFAGRQMRGCKGQVAEPDAARRPREQAGV